jgi:dynein intermediate chain 1
MEHVQFHFEVDGYMVWNVKDEDEEVPQEEEGAGEKFSFEEEKKQPLRNQFNYSERASQTAQFTIRDKSTNTEPPPTRSFSDCVNQYVIYDSYVEDQALKSKSTKAEKKKQNPNHNTTTLELLPTDHIEDVYYK